RGTRRGRGLRAAARRWRGSHTPPAPVRTKRTCRRVDSRGARATRALAQGAGEPRSGGEGLAEEMDVVPPVGDGGAKGDEIELCGELAVDVVRRVIGAAQARARRSLVENHDVPARERVALRF